MSNTIKYTWEKTNSDTRGKTWEYHRENINQVCYAHARAKCLREMSKDAVRIKEHRVNLLWTMKTASVDINWTVLKNSVAAAAYLQFVKVSKELVSNGEGALDMLKTMRRQTLFDTTNYEATLKLASDINNDAIKKFDNLVKDYSFIRNTGATILCASAGVIAAAPAGISTAAASILAGGAVLKGVGKFQDTGQIGTALVETGGEVILFVTGVKGASVVGSATKEFFYGMFTKVSVEGVKSYVGGDSLPQALSSALFEALPLGALKDGLIKRIGASSCSAVVKATSEHTIEAVQSMAVDKAKDVTKSGIQTLTSERPFASKNVRYVDDAYLNLKTGSAADDQYVRKFCIRPSSQR